MPVLARVWPGEKWLRSLAALTFTVGAFGMAISFLFLASAHHLDVLAGGAGFLAGSILVAAGLVSLSLQKTARTVAARGLPTFDHPLDVEYWVGRFRRNRENRPEPDWLAPVTVAEDVVHPLVRSLEQFQLGDGGGPAYLIARDREQFLSESAGTRAL